MINAMLSNTQEAVNGTLFVRLIDLRSYRVKPC